MLQEEKKRKLESVNNTGFAADKTAGDRYINKQGSLNLDITGVNVFKRFSIYHSLLTLPNFYFFILIIVFYSIINFIFASLYMFLGVENLHGIIAQNWYQDFYEAYFFSSQTLTTVGYGRVSPVGIITNIVASFEALIGIMTLALMTGLLYGRFTRPRPFLRYSDVALIAPFQEGKGLMFRLAPTKKHTLSDLRATVTMSINSETNGVIKNHFYNLPLQVEKIMSLALSWTIVHPIDEESPLFNLTKKDIDEGRVHIMVFIKGFDEGFSNTVVSRSEYLWNNIKVDAKFLPMFKINNGDKKSLLQLERINAHEEMNPVIVERKKRRFRT